MNYKTYQPSANLASVVKCYWTLEVPADKEASKQRILPDGCIELIFILGDDVKRVISKNKFTIQPRAMVLGQITKPFFVEPTGYVNSFAVRFYPYGFANFVSTPLKYLTDKEIPLERLFGKKCAQALQQKIVQATSTRGRIEIMEDFLLDKLKTKTTIDAIVRSTVDMIFSTNGSASIKSILKGELSKRRQLERKFLKQIGVSPKQLGKVIRLQTALKMLANQQAESLTKIAYESEYYDQAHFIKDFKEFTGANPKGFFEDEKMELSTLFYTEELGEVDKLKS